MQFVAKVFHIGLDASRATTAHRTGTENYARRILQGLLAAAPEQTFTLYFRAPPPPKLFPTHAHTRYCVIPFPRLWTHLRLSWELLTAHPRPDVLFVPAHVLPLVNPVPAVVTVHDLGYRHFPEAHPPRQRAYLDWSTRFSARAAHRIIADSQATRADLAHFYAIPREKITVVYPGYDDTLRPGDPTLVREKYQLPERYVLHVGTLQPRKNLARLIEAVGILNTKIAAPVTLVLAGQPGWLAAPLLAQARTNAAYVRLLGYVPDADLAGLYSGAAAFAFPSLYEGFGFPVLEAMACGTPVVCANTASLPELVGDAALQVNPLDAVALATALHQLLTDAPLVANLRARGFEQIKRFSWAKAVRETLEVLMGG